MKTAVLWKIGYVKGQQKTVRAGIRHALVDLILGYFGVTRGMVEAVRKVIMFCLTGVLLYTLFVFVLAM
jgi:hypothetical protein